MRRKSLTLIEVVVALSLAGILLGVVMTLFYQASKKNIEVQALKKAVLPIELMRQRLTYLFAHLEGEEDPAERRFHTLAHEDAVGEALVFAYNYGIDPNPIFCGMVKGMLYLNSRKQLCLATWGSKTDVRQEVFLDEVYHLSFEFFHQKEKKWKPAWDQKDPPPSMFKISWATAENAQEEEKIACVFFLAEQELKVIYPKSPALTDSAPDSLEET